MGRLGATCFVILLLIVGVNGVAFADGPHGDVDQSFTGPFGSQGPALIFNSGRSVSQEFVPQSTQLGAIDVYVFSTSPCNDNWTVNIREGPGLGSILTDGTISNYAVSFSASRSSPHIEHIHFDPHVSLTPGSVHTIEIQSSQPTNFQNCLWVAGDTSNPYTLGRAYLGTEVQPIFIDLGFATYSQGSSNPPAPTPTSDNDPVVGGKIIPIDTTALLLAGTQITASWLIPIVVTSVGISLVILRKL